MNTAVTARCNVQIESSSYTLHRLSLLIQCIQTGRLGKRIVRPPMHTASIASKIGVSRKIVRDWLNGVAMPQSEYFKFIAESLLGVAEEDLKAYLYGRISIQALLSVKNKHNASDRLIDKCNALETSEYTLHRLSLLFECIQTGRFNKKIIRPPMTVSDIVKKVKVSRKTFYEWKNGTSMPQSSNFYSIAENLLGVTEENLKSYLYGDIELLSLLAIKPEQAKPEDVVHKFSTLDEHDKNVVLAQLLRDRALELGNFSLPKKNKRLNYAISSTGVLKEDNSVASFMGDGLSPHVAVRLRNLLIASQEKHSRVQNEQLDLDQIAERQGVHPRTYNIDALEEAAEGLIGETYGHRLFAPEWNALSAICFEPTGWHGDQPIGLTDRTFQGRVELLKRSLSENGNPNRV